MSAETPEPRKKSFWRGDGLLCAIVAMQAILAASFGELSYRKAQSNPEPVRTYEQRSGYSRILRQTHFGDAIERVVQYDADPGLEYVDCDGTYTARFPSPETREDARAFLRDKYCPGKRRQILESMDADKDGEITGKELTDFIGD